MPENNKPVSALSHIKFMEIVGRMSFGGFWSASAYNSDLMMAMDEAKESLACLDMDSGGYSGIGEQVASAKGKMEEASIAVDQVLAIRSAISSELVEWHRLGQIGELDDVVDSAAQAVTILQDTVAPLLSEAKEDVSGIDAQPTAATQVELVVSSMDAALVRASETAELLADVISDLSKLD